MKRFKIFNIYGKRKVESESIEVKEFGLEDGFKRLKVPRFFTLPRNHSLLKRRDWLYTIFMMFLLSAVSAFILKNELFDPFITVFTAVFLPLLAVAIVLRNSALRDKYEVIKFFMDNGYAEKYPNEVMGILSANSVDEIIRYGQMIMRNEVKEKVYDVAHELIKDNVKLKRELETIKEQIEELKAARSLIKKEIVVHEDIEYSENISEREDNHVKILHVQKGIKCYNCRRVIEEPIRLISGDILCPYCLAKLNVTSVPSPTQISFLKAYEDRLRELEEKVRKLEKKRK